LSKVLSPETTFDERIAQRTAAIGIVGLGYAGLPLAMAFAETGFDVTGIDLNEQRVRAVQSRVSYLVDVPEERYENLEATLSATTDYAAVAQLDALTICVPTPLSKTRTPDLNFIVSAAESVGSNIKPGMLIVLQSTTHPGTTEEVVLPILEQRSGGTAGKDFFLGYAPERVDPGNATFTIKNTPKLVAGVTEECLRRTALLYEQIVDTVQPVSSPMVAETAKLHENTFRAVNIALANEFASIARQFEIDVTEVICAAATKPYGFMPFHPGPGVGGHCIPCDPHYLLWQLKASNLPSPVTEAAMASIAARPHEVVSRAQEVLADAGRPLRGARILIVGVAYKPAVADVRESPALRIIDELIHHGADVSFTDVMVESLSTPWGPLLRESDPASRDWDLVIAHTLHPSADLSWLCDVSNVLDATYKLPSLVHRSVL
jgi:UDP-N-acetyl-D-glucosamine dehydrogenase